MIRTRSAGGVVVNPEGKVLVVSQNRDSWSLPKGHLEAGENIHAAAAREISEESGISRLIFIKELGTYERYRIAKGGGEDPSERKVITIFLMTTTEQILKPRDPNNPEARWVECDKVSELLTHPKDKAFYASVQDEIQKFVNHKSPKS